jgi:ketosteroid isomerase-like protein
MLDDLRAEIDQVVHDEGDTLVVVIRTSGSPRGSSAPVHGRYSVVYTIRDGQIVRGREYETPEKALEALDVPQPGE